MGKEIALRISPSSSSMVSTNNSISCACLSLFSFLHLTILLLGYLVSLFVSCLPFCLLLVRLILSIVQDHREEGVARVITRGPTINKVCSVLK